MQTKAKLETKKRELEAWLISHADHPNRSVIETDLRLVNEQIEKGEYEV